MQRWLNDRIEKGGDWEWKSVGKVFCSTHKSLGLSPRPHKTRYTPVITSLKRQMQENENFKAILGYTESSRSTSIHEISSLKPKLEKLSSN